MTIDPNLETDVDPEETREWREAMRAVVEREGPDRARELLAAVLDEAAIWGAPNRGRVNTPYINTIPASRDVVRPGDGAVERYLKSLIRWNATAMVVRANANHSGLGGHIATYASAATLYEVGFNHFFRASVNGGPGDLIFFQGHASPGIYARAYLEGRLDESQLDLYRQETGGGGLSSYPHPWLMPGFWSIPTVSMGLGPIMAIYQARFMKYLENRGLAPRGDRTVWAFLGDGEMDEPESLGGLSIAAREELDNLVFVVNCNLQRLDGPVRGNGKIIQELESQFRGAGWNVIKVIWGRSWDPLLAEDETGLLRQRMMEAVDGDYQTYAVKGGAYIREQFFGKYPELQKLVEGLSDDELWRLRRGGHDPEKVYSAFQAARAHKGQPTVVLAKSIKGYGLSYAAEGLNIAHQKKSLAEVDLLAFRDRFDLPIPDDQARHAEYFKPPEDSPELTYLRSRREALGGPLPARPDRFEPLDVPPLERFAGLLRGSGKREMSTTMAFVRFLMTLLRDQELASRVVPIIADEARTFGMEGLFRQLGIYAPKGQLYEPEDIDQLAYYREAADGQILQEGLNEAGAFSSWVAAATSQSQHGVAMIPFFIFYSMFGFQRVGDLAWAAADMRARGFLIGATSGRTTLNGEGLQHEDGHSHVLASTVPTCVAYDPTYAYEVAVILQDGLRRMYADGEDIYYYVTTTNENYLQPAMPEGVEAGIRRGMYLLRPSKRRLKKRVQLLGSGAILREVLAAAELLETEHQVAADVWSVTSFNELRRDGLSAERWSRLHPELPAQPSFVETCLADHPGPVVAATDYMKTYADQIRAFVPGRYLVLGTDGFGRSDSRERLRRFFEVDRGHVVVAALSALSREGAVSPATVRTALETYDIDPEAPDPTTI